jgi:hypothetical protein
MGEMTFRRFDPEDARRMQRVRITTPVVGMTAEVEGRIVGYGGVFQYGDGRHWGFFSVFDERYRRPVVIHRFASGILRVMQDAGIAVHALCDLGHPRADLWLRRLGFRLLEESERDDDVRSLIAHHVSRSGTEHEAYVHDRA